MKSLLFGFSTHPLVRITLVIASTIPITPRIIMKRRGELTINAIELMSVARAAIIPRI